MDLTLHSWWPLGLLAVLPIVWWMPARTLTSFGPRQLRVQAVVRATLLALLAFALAEPVVRWSSRQVSVAYAVDVSESVSAEGVANAARWIEQSRTASGGWTRVLAFGAEAAVVDTPAALEQPTLPVRRDATNLDAAITAALGMFPSESARRLVLFTDGHTTSGDLKDAIVRAAESGVRIFTVPVAVRAARDGWIETVEAPGEVTAGEPFTLRVSLGTQTTQSAVVQARLGNRILASQAVQLRAGSTAVSLAPRVPTPGAHQLQVTLQASEDAEPRNNDRRLPVVAQDRPRVLYVESRAESARYLKEALGAGGFDVETIDPLRLPATVDGLDRFAAVILSDVSRRDVTDERMAALDRYVAELGGGLVMAGGEAMYGVEGYAKTQLERTLPVTFQMKDRPDEFAMIIVLDKSWSMAGQKIELAKEAAVAAVEVLPDRHRIGLITFNDGLEWAVPLQLAANRTRIVAAIRAIVPSGHTNLFPAVDEAARALLPSKAELKHVLVLSDGRTYPDAYEALVGKMVEGKITVSSVALGDDADRELLENLATWGRGRAYVVENAAEVPQVFVKETQRATRSTFVEQPYRPVVKKTAELLQGLDFSIAPFLAGYARVRAKDTAEVILAAGDDDDPILVRWQYGLGRAVVFTSDVKDRWAHDWLTWRGYGRFWTQLVRETIRRDRAGPAATPPVSAAADGLDETALERRYMPADTELLAAISRDTGGAFDPKPEEAFADLGDRTATMVPLWPWLAGLAAGLWLADLALRRVRLLEVDR